MASRKTLKTAVVILLFYKIFGSCSSSENKISAEEKKSREEAHKLSAYINDILKTYDKKARPNAGGDAVQVMVEGKVVAFGELKEASMEYSMDIFFRQWWYDPRFAHNFSKPFTMAADATKIFWTPDTYFVNVKNSKYHHVTRENMRVMIDPDGRIYFSTRITLTLQCDMDFRLFPMDTQHCPVVIESYAYTVADVDFSWKIKEKTQGIEIVSQEMAQFDLLGVVTSSKDTGDSKTTFASLKAVFSFKRRIEFFIFSAFTPAIILVILSWCCFWISSQAVPARVSLGITTILTTILLSSSVNSNMPRVSYIKSIDYFLLTNFGFIFFSFLEYVIVLNTNPEPKWIKIFKERVKAAREADVTRDSNGRETPMQMTPIKKCGPVVGSESHVHVQAFDKSGRGRDVATVVIPKEPTSQDPSVVVVTTHANEPPTVTRRRKSDFPRNREPAKKSEPAPKPKVHWVDYVSRALFPAAYVMFLGFYWISSLAASELQAARMGQP
ncbi:gamma-aminobutyric acid receptor subunit beta-like [Nematostella vectensis]|uniref:gamma-aminobutyric acid receptor subunit beta-like n=1 Tax=Nematostella vectensis TaxID=45351 RepID=UPI002076E31B|nr:gamma-aminobutyric acid receptor subunit beta-like [Nematostella vectensis]